MKAVSLLSALRESVSEPKSHVMESQRWISGEEREQRSRTHPETHMWGVTTINLLALVNHKSTYCTCFCNGVIHWYQRSKLSWAEQIDNGEGKPKEIMWTRDSKCSKLKRKLLQLRCICFTVRQPLGRTPPTGSVKHKKLGRVPNRLIGKMWFDENNYVPLSSS